ncbi:MAG: caspase family protein [Muribaculaceae bacterium]|nr:caspase family protein [Muribaculaceae bacterium]
MKRIFSILLLTLVMVMSLNARTFVLCVGVSNYDDDELNLSQTTKDAKQFKSVMENATKDITILTSKYANKENIKEKLRAISNRAQKGDKIIFFYSGHGYPGGVAVYDNALTYQEINDILAKSAADAKICFVDACHAGSVSNVTDNSKNYKAPTSGNIIYMLGSRADEYSLEHPWVGHGFFTQALLKGLRGKADANKDKKITVKELFNYVYNDVQHTTEKMEVSQHPQLIGQKAVVDTVVIDWN